MQAKARLAAAQEQARLAQGLPQTQQGRTDYSQDFFEKPAFLTVSGQLNAEIFATALSDVYTFGELKWLPLLLGRSLPAHICSPPLWLVMISDW